jgi:hypothetical protein
MQTVAVTGGVGSRISSLYPCSRLLFIQKRGSKLAWVVVLSVYGAVTIAIDLSLSALIS